MVAQAQQLLPARPVNHTPQHPQSTAPGRRSNLHSATTTPPQLHLRPQTPQKQHHPLTSAKGSRHTNRFLFHLEQDTKEAPPSQTMQHHPVTLLPQPARCLDHFSTSFIQHQTKIRHHQTTYAAFHGLTCHLRPPQDDAQHGTHPSAHRQKIPHHCSQEKTAARSQDHFTTLHPPTSPPHLSSRSTLLSPTTGQQTP